MSIYKEPPPGMFVVPDPHDMTKVSISTLLPLMVIFLFSVPSILPSIVIFLLNNEGINCMCTVKILGFMDNTFTAFITLD